ncbi:hypothetical protein P3S68_021472 [Capsicum galapagoense]
MILVGGEKLLGSLGGILSKTWNPKTNHEIIGPIITRGSEVKFLSESFLMALNYSLEYALLGAKSDREMESAQAKNQALRDAGAVVPNSYESFEGMIKEAFENLVIILTSSTLNNLGRQHNSCKGNNSFKYS